MGNYAGAMAASPKRTLRPVKARAAAASALDEGVAWHQAGRLEAAEAAYRRILAAQPLHAEAMQLLGVVRHQRGDHPGAIELIEQAIRLAPQQAAFHSNLGLALRAVGRLDEAATALATAVQLDGGYLAARKNLGVVLQELGRLDEAADHLDQAIDAAPGDPQAYRTLASLRLKQGRAQAAVESLMAARALAPDSLETLNNLALALRQLGRLAEAERVLTRAVAIDGRHADTRNHLGLVLADRGQAEKAIAQYRAAIEAEPSHVLATNNLAVALKDLGRWTEARVALEGCLKRWPDYVPALNNLGEIYNKFGQPAEGEALLQRAVTLDPKCFEAHNNLAISLKDQGRLAEAQEQLEQALSLNPNYVPALINLGNALIAQAQVAAGLSRFQEAVTREPDSIPAWYAIASSGKHDFTDDELRRIEALLARPSTSVDERGLLSFALAHASDKRREAERAIAFGHEANRIRREEYRRRGMPFVLAQHEALVDAIVETFTRDYFTAVPPPGANDPLPVFVVGMPRSGTTLVEQILCSHPRVHGAGELNDILSILLDELPRSLGAPQGYPRYFAREAMPSQAAELRRVSERHLAYLRELGGEAQRVVDKMTISFLHLGPMHLLFPGGRVVHCRRDPRDTCLSCYLHNFASPGLHFTFSLDDLAGYYVQYERVMTHWRAHLPGTFLEVPYEQFLEDQEGFTRRMIDFIGMPWDDACLSFHENRRTVKTASNLQVREPIHKRSRGRWQKYAHELAPLVAGIRAGRARYGLPDEWSDT